MTATTSHCPPAAEAGEEESVLYADYDEKAYKDFGKQLAVIRLDKQRCFHA